MVVGPCATAVSRLHDGDEQSREDVFVFAKPSRVAAAATGQQKQERNISADREVSRKKNKDYDDIERNTHE